jgi:hypothetical protein|tara:strand:- start:9714 stop:10631 length:918 start_codon:yes stop_codon:yes gene_type:complete
MAYLTGYQYYENEGNTPEELNWGSYQYLSLADVVNNFMLMYVGNDKLVNNVHRYNVLFHAKRAIQELNYDALKEIKVLEMSICDDLKLVLPPDYVSWVRMSLFKDGSLMPLTENIQTNYAKSYLQDNDCKILFDESGNVLIGTSLLDYDRITGQARDMYLGDGSMKGQTGYNVDGNWFFDYTVEARFGLNTETANVNPTFRIDKKSGVINFSSEMADQIIVLEYVTDGMEDGDNDEIEVHKMFEEFIYAYIKYVILTNKVNVQEYVVARAKKEKTALLRNARIRMSNIHPGRLLMNMRGRNKWIK